MAVAMTNFYEGLTAAEGRMAALMYSSVGTGGIAMDHTLTPAQPLTLSSVYVNVGTAATTAENLVITIKDGSDNSMCVVQTKAMAGVTDWVYQPTRPLELASSWYVHFEWTNTDARIWVLSVAMGLPA